MWDARGTDDPLDPTLRGVFASVITTTAGTKGAAHHTRHSGLHKGSIKSAFIQKVELLTD